MSHVTIVTCVGSYVTCDALAGPSSRNICVPHAPQPDHYNQHAAVMMMIVVVVVMMMIDMIMITMMMMTIFINTQQSYPSVASPSRFSIDGGVGGCRSF